MGAKPTFEYDRDADILHIDKCAPNADQQSAELGDDVIARVNPQTGAIESLEMLFFSTRRLRDELFGVAIDADLHIAAAE